MPSHQAADRPQRLPDDRPASPSLTRHTRPRVDISSPKAIICPMESTKITAIDLFCGAGGLSAGLKEAAIDVVAGIDVDPACRYPFERNIGGVFIQQDVASVTGEQLQHLWNTDGPTLLAGCAPCQPFSSHRRGADTSQEQNWGLLGHFSRLVTDSLPDFVTMENVTRIASSKIFTDFTIELKQLDYSVQYQTLYGPDYGLPQERRRLVLLASRRGAIQLPTRTHTKDQYVTVRDTIGRLPAVKSGETDPFDPLHTARKLNDLNIKRIQKSSPGGDWTEWPADLVAECHKKPSGKSFKSFYGRMVWDAPSPTITTQSYNYGTGRFGHPEQDRALTLRESAMLQGFPQDYAFTPPGVAPSRQAIGRLIGNAVPPIFGKAVGEEFVKAIETAPPKRP